MRLLTKPSNECRFAPLDRLRRSLITTLRTATMKKVPIEKEKYSEESKRSVGHWFLKGYYSDITYKCMKCKSESTFSAEEQKYAYEVQKKYMWAKRVLCTSCWKRLNEIKQELLLKEAAYLENRKFILTNKVFLEEWLILLTEYVKYGKRGNKGRMYFIKKHLNAIEST